ncbi:polysaccharide export protein [Sphingomonas sp. SUN019]|uniref:polysaccharide biosynthesis/export family protein n=1 Tax=Sphingomonas sp. SUN019 TaxID=2937788 RepID=UPI00216414FD|nr:polysaccharide biosynthesis/export family protein [Sphingomonas sp. SUN019]UVO52379.1 polysaccharide export protein [Sphingomonas sp. SUN019]
MRYADVVRMRPGLWSNASLLVVAALLTGCSTLPSSGPTAAQINGALKNNNQTGFTIVDIDAASAQQLAFAPPPVGGLAALDRPGRIDTLGPGDVLDINVYEVGVTLFTGPNDSSAQGGRFNPSARSTALSNVVVDSAGDIQLPYVGKVNVLGKTTAEVQNLIERGLRGLSQRPQALVSVKDNAFNVFYVSGDVRAPGRMPLRMPRERLLDALARAGGTVNQPDDMIVRLTRDGVSAETRLSAVDASGAQNIQLLPGDRVELFNRPRTFLVFGASEKVSQVAFGADRLSMAEALARIGGPSDRLADPSAVYLFRYVTPTADRPEEKPIIYRLNMVRPDSYFLSQRIGMHDKDVIYIAGASSNAPGKLAGILGQLFSPILAVRAVAQ